MLIDRKLRVYVASSWRNEHQQQVVATLRGYGCEVYDFRNPLPPGQLGKDGFSWKEIDPHYERWTAQQYVAALKQTPAKRGFHLDYAAMLWADACVLVAPAGASAHLELGWSAGAGKRTCLLIIDKFGIELMVKIAERIVTSISQLIEWIEEIEEKAPYERPRLVYNNECSEPLFHLASRCPFCSSDNLSLLTTNPGSLRVECGDCYAQGPVRPTMETACTAWNQGHEGPPTRKRTQNDLDVLLAGLGDDDMGTNDDE